jgi:hypothetical protein
MSERRILTVDSQERFIDRVHLSATSLRGMSAATQVNIDVSLKVLSSGMRVGYVMQAEARYDDSTKIILYKEKEDESDCRWHDVADDGRFDESVEKHDFAEHLGTMLQGKGLEPLVSGGSITVPLQR